ncbi:hypothetical protein M9458_033004, partial [Cirrhinus mrigala]
QRAANRQSFQQRPTQQTSANPKALSSVPGPVSTQINSILFCRATVAAAPAAAAVATTGPSMNCKV